MRRPAGCSVRASSPRTPRCCCSSGGVRRRRRDRTPESLLVAARLLIREYYTCFKERRFADPADLFASEVLERPLFGTLKNGGHGYLQLVDVWVNAFPDSKARIEHVEQRGDTICEVEFVLTGTHLGDLSLPSHGVF